ncbi:ABC transporter substrate-binding protein [Castellaniella sp.]|uniref:ABC transporter substrate-binding protein n=1 Tax=Castellaniella sp. TaxID=1955812 RepID=UPI0025C64CC6|nr:ABC transporter substrate-binding protein [Castellaniella sp.]
MPFTTKLLFLTMLLASSMAGAQATTTTEVGYMPIIPDSQTFVVLDHQTRDNPLANTKLIEFQDGPEIVQALLAGQLDVAYVGIGPVMVARSKGADLKVVATNIVSQISFLALGDLAPYFSNGAAQTAFERFAKDKGRKPVITTFPRGSVPDIVLQYWLQNVLKVSPDSVRVIYQGAAQAQQALLTGAVDGAAILEPIISTVLARQPDAKVVADGSVMFPDQPGAVLAVREKLIQQNPAFVQKLVAAHVQATGLLRDDPEKVAPAVQKYVGGGRLPAPIVLAALKRSHDQFSADPHRILKATQDMYDYQKKLGTLQGKLDVQGLFDTQFYDRLK